MLDETKLDPESRRQLWEIRVGEQLKELEVKCSTLLESVTSMLEVCNMLKKRTEALEDRAIAARTIPIVVPATVTESPKEGLLQRILRWWTNRDSLKTFGAARSSAWPRVRAEHLREHPNCEVCGGNKTIEVHHKQPFHLNPSLELEPSNLITLCESGANGIVCHRAIGHLGSYQSVNVNVEEDAKIWHDKITHRPQ